MMYSTCIPKYISSSRKEGLILHSLGKHLSRSFSSSKGTPLLIEVSQPRLPPHKALPYLVSRNFVTSTEEADIGH